MRTRGREVQALGLKCYLKERSSKNYHILTKISGDDVSLVEVGKGFGISSTRAGKEILLTYFDNGIYLMVRWPIKGMAFWSSPVLVVNNFERDCQNLKFFYTGSRT